MFQGRSDEIRSEERVVFCCAALTAKSGFCHNTGVLPKASVSIFCEVPNMRYRLRVGDDGGSEIFTSEDDAVRRACALIEEDSTLTIYAVDGSRLVVAVIYPERGD